MTEGSPPIEVFCSYAHKDEVWLRKLIIHLRFLEHERSLLIWHDRLLKGGMDWAQEIDDRLNHSRLILLLISPDFVASDYCYGIEMRRALERHEANEARVIPILVRPIGNWQNAPFAHLQALPPGKFLVEWSEREEDIPLAQIANGIYDTLEDLPMQPVSRPHGNQPVIWNIPYPRNPFFTGRDELISRIQTQLQQGHSSAISQPQGISGLGGIGKTQIAIEYAYRNRQNYQAVFWSRADTRDALISGYMEIAQYLDLPQKDGQDKILVVEAVHQWFKLQTQWLLILDNADELAIISEFLPPTFGGHILLTTRAQSTGKLAQRLEVDTMDRDAGALLLLRRAGLVTHDALLNEASSSDIALAREITQELGGLPLALDQAGAYIEATQHSLSEYQSLYHTHRAVLLETRGNLVDDHPEPVATTWLISFVRLEEKNPAAADLLSLCSCLAPDEIPEGTLKKGASSLGSWLEAVVADPFQFGQSIEALRAYSLLSRDPQTKTLSVHRLVQVTLRNNMDTVAIKLWLERAIKVVVGALPDNLLDRHYSELIYNQAQACLDLTHIYSVSLPEIIDLLGWIGTYIADYGRYQEAQPLLERALQISEQVYGMEHEKTVEWTHNLAWLYRRMRKYTEAEPLFLRALAIEEQRLGPKHLEVSFILNVLAFLYMQQSMYAKAEPLFLRALEIRKQELGLEHPDTAQILGNLARFYTRQDKYDQAEQIGQQSLIIREQKLGFEHPDTAQSLNIMATLYHTQKNYMKAEPLYQRALAIYNQQLGSGHPSTQTVRRNYASLLRKIGRIEEAEKL